MQIRQFNVKKISKANQVQVSFDKIHDFYFNLIYCPTYWENSNCL